MTTSVDTVRLSRLVLSCLRLLFGHRQLKQVWDATDTPTTPEEALPSPDKKFWDEMTQAIAIGNFHRFFRVFKLICSGTVNSILWTLINKHACFAACNHHYVCVFALSGDSAEQRATSLMITGITVGQHTHSTEWLLLL